MKLPKNEHYSDDPHVSNGFQFCGNTVIANMTTPRVKYFERDGKKLNEMKEPMQDTEYYARRRESGY